MARRQGYERALTEAGIPVDPGLVVEGDWEEQSGLTVVERLLAAKTRFTAIFCGNVISNFLRDAFHEAPARIVATGRVSASHAG